MNDTISSPELRERYDAAVSELVASGRIIMRSASGWSAAFYENALGAKWTDAAPCGSCWQYGSPASEPCPQCGSWYFGEYVNPASTRRFPAPDTCNHGVLIVSDCEACEPLLYVPGFEPDEYDELAADERRHALC